MDKPNEKQIKRVVEQPLELLELVMYGNEYDGTRDQAYEDLKRILNVNKRV